MVSNEAKCSDGHSSIFWMRSCKIMIIHLVTTLPWCFSSMMKENVQGRCCSEDRVIGHVTRKGLTLMQLRNREIGKVVVHIASKLENSPK